MVLAEMDWGQRIELNMACNARIPVPGNGMGTNRMEKLFF